MGVGPEKGGGGQVDAFQRSSFNGFIQMQKALRSSQRLRPGLGLLSPRCRWNGFVQTSPTLRRPLSNG